MALIETGVDFVGAVLKQLKKVEQIWFSSLKNANSIKTNSYCGGFGKSGTAGCKVIMDLNRRGVRASDLGA